MPARPGTAQRASRYFLRPKNGRMKKASTDVSHTITAAASQSARPSIENPSETRSVMISATSVASRATPPTAEDDPLRRSDFSRNGGQQPERDGEEHDRDQEARHVDIHAVEHKRGNDQADGVRHEHDGRTDDRPDHAATLHRRRSLDRRHRRRRPRPRRSPPSRPGAASAHRGCSRSRRAGPPRRATRACSTSYLARDTPHASWNEP